MQMDTWLIATIVLVLFGVYLLALCCIYMMQDRLIFARHHILNSSYEISPQMLFTHTNAEGIRLDGIYKHTGTLDLIIWFEGNSNNIHEIAGKIDKLDGYDVVGINYQGYGNSGGAPSEKSIFKDALHLYDTLERKYKRVFVLGRSLGSGVAVYLSKHRSIAGAILITPYDSISSVASAKYRFFLVSLFIKHKFDSVKHLVGNDTKFAVLEVQNDLVVPNKHSQRLIRSITNLTYSDRFDGVSHSAVTDDERFIPFVQKSLKSFE